MLVVSAFALFLPGTAHADVTYIGPEPPTSYFVQGAWYDTDVALLESMTGASSDNTARVSNASLLRTGWEIEIASDHGPVPERMIINEILSDCDNAVDDNGNTLVNEGCPTVDDGIPHPETGTECDNAVDDDEDGKINDGCPTVDDGVPNPETGGQCAQGDTVDDDLDGYVNDGCPAMDPGGVPSPETGEQCENNCSDDDDTKTNDGCPAVGDPETGDQCNYNVDDDEDGWINDGCPAVAAPEGLSYCADPGETGLDDLDDDDDGYANDGCPTVDVEEETGDQCANALDDDGDGKINDGCPEYDIEKETGAECTNALDDDADGKVNDGCFPESEYGSQCLNAIDDDGDDLINDGCPAQGAAETGAACNNAVDDDGDGKINDGCPYKESSALSTVVVTRWVNGVADTHTAGALIRDHIATTDIWIRNIPEDHEYGLGTFDLQVSFDPDQLEYLRMDIDTTWIESTGRTAWCNGPTAGTGTVQANCLTSGDPYDPPWPKGATGSGKIATIWFKLKTDDICTRYVSLAGSGIYDLYMTPFDASVQNYAVRTVTCPDTNLDTWVNTLDRVEIYLNYNDRGQNSGASLAESIDSEQTVIEVTSLGSLAVGQVIAVETEPMSVTAVSEGPPATIEVTRGLYSTPPVYYTQKPHESSVPIFIASYDGNYDSKMGYNDPRDTNNDLALNALDAVAIIGVLNTQCP
jgi:hypothetical protein